jgi:hypothetical protein
MAAHLLGQVLVVGCVDGGELPKRNEIEMTFFFRILNYFFYREKKISKNCQQ